MTEAHHLCTQEGHHICLEPSGRICYEPSCDEPAGTWWGPLWCPKHDKERLDRISGQLRSIVRKELW